MNKDLSTQTPSMEIRLMKLIYFEGGRNMNNLIPLILLTFTFGCLQSQDSNSKSIKREEEIEYSPVIENVHPKAKNILDEDFYFSSVDETGPFGSDDAADTYIGLILWRKNNRNINPEKYLYKHLSEWGYPSFDLLETDIEKLQPYLSQSNMHFRYLLGTDQAILAIAFGQLYLEGEIDSEMLTLAEKALQRHLTPVMLSIWPEDYQIERKNKLLKMKKVIDKLKNLP
ncbi:hypothetical protein OO013_16985 [Mangrovivirga sp. M17]|uniref:Uncharacterized protein n=1 Tax=Mangrovivirga halotolerans TaxID=2993936 RepID=A0ABT3RUY2_9BACT|nr:hypothetical protein [Mangrovivirga halotolerans]MCX2745579.1 hypothetical protein [Mangrovivirga halotolerans]